ncbi:hypothetical protein [Candidatus Mycobacterium methanotrophicum]|uniref:Uncharacterized protein n=1 Tax=Candidatus Mycobacterium methanotrophicum TaxID=2943498 RepID=A0ABY4QR71_9MYCO|nr:hypothetical protein [Candidatus Mycobacterium methanotrophicum]UQX13520.1 hypothetical protein M5I08_25335 [Candidatus Mycobacterium methanotrophicum]
MFTTARDDLSIRASVLNAVFGQSIERQPASLVPMSSPVTVDQKGDKMNELNGARMTDGDRQLEAVAANIIHQVGDALYEALPADVAHDHFVDARQATNDRAIDFAKELISGYAKRTVEPVPSNPDRALGMAHRLVASSCSGCPDRDINPRPRPCRSRATW